jgi:hypothetical protein
MNFRKGIPCSMILPQSMVFDDIVLLNQKNLKKLKPPVVPNPLMLLSK